MSLGVVKQTEAVLNHHLQALAARDLDGLVSDYTEESVIINNLSPTPIQGLGAIRQFMAQMVEVFTPEVLATFKASQQVIEGEIVYVVWSAGKTIPFGTDTVVVRDGKIVAQTAYAQMGAGG